MEEGMLQQQAAGEEEIYKGLVKGIWGGIQKK